MMYAALHAAQDSLEVLRRGHGVEVSSVCYPALNLVRDVLAPVFARSRSNGG